MFIKKLAYFCSYTGALSAIAVAWAFQGFHNFDGIVTNLLPPFALAFALIASTLEPLLIAEVAKERLRISPYINLVGRGILAGIMCAFCWWILYNLGNAYKNVILFILAGYGAAVGIGFLGLTIGPVRNNKIDR